jgi:hypothetical protein
MTDPRTTPAAPGSSSCEICPLAASGTASFALGLNNSFETVAGSYYAEAWLHAPVDASTTGETGIQVFLTFDDGGEPPDYQGSEIAPNDGQMTLQIDTYVGGGCVLVDDVAIYAQ